jgi:hypothetical protein
MAKKKEQKTTGDHGEPQLAATPQAASEAPLLGSADFEFDLGGPFFEQIFKRLQLVQPIPLTVENINDLKELPGVYVLHMDGREVYVGKADDSVVVRLRKHRRTLSGCQNIQPSQMTFRCLYVASTWSPLNYEERVMENLGTKRMPGWNGNGFGSN